MTACNRQQLSRPNWSTPSGNPCACVLAYYKGPQTHSQVVLPNKCPGCRDMWLYGCVSPVNSQPLSAHTSRHTAGVGEFATFVAIHACMWNNMAVWLCGTRKLCGTQ